MPTINTGQVNIYYESEGRGQTLVFLHGFTLDRRMWRRQVEYFKSHYRVIAYDSRGHGKSDCPPSGYSRADRVHDLEALVKDLKLPRFHLIGLSMGGATALGYAIDNQEKLRSLTLVDTAAGGYDPPKKYKDMRQVAMTESVDKAKRRWIKTALFYYLNKNEGLRAELAEMMKDHCGHLWLDPRRGKYPDRNDVELSHQIKVATMIFVGEKDRYFLPLARTLHKNISDSELDIVPDVGHMLNIEAPDRFNRRLEQFLQRIG